MVAVYGGNGASEPVAQEYKERGPEHAAYNVVRKKGAILHLTHAREYRREGAHNWDKAREDDCLLSILFVKCPRAFNVFFMKEKRIFAVKNLRTDFFPERIADAVAEDCTEHTTKPQQHDIEMTLRRKDPRGKEERIAGEKKTEKEPGLGKDNRKDADEAEGLDEKRRVEDVERIHDLRCTVAVKV